MLQTSDEKIPLVLLMFLEGKTGDHLAALAKAKNTKYRARGYLAFDGKRRFFEPSRCTFIHRVPPIDPGNQPAAHRSHRGVYQVE
jgi:hypothetical protein